MEGAEEAIGNCRRCLRYLNRNLRTVLCQTAVLLGLVLGKAASPIYDSTDVGEMLIGFPGKMLAWMLQLVTVPLIVVSVYLGVNYVRLPVHRKVGLRLAVYFVSTTLMAVAAGLTLVVLLKPGYSTPVLNVDDDDEEKPFISDSSVMDLFRNMVPFNLLQACYQHYLSRKVEFEVLTSYNASLEANHTEAEAEETLVVEFVEGFNILGLLLGSFVFGLSSMTMGERRKVVVEFVSGLNEVIKYTTNSILWYMPFGLLSMAMTHVVEDGDWDTVLNLGQFAAVIVGGLLLHSFVILPLVYVVAVRRNPAEVFKGAYPALVTALLLSSSSAAMPLTIRFCEQSRIDPRIWHPVLPVATRVNRDGTAMYQAVSAVFVAQLRHISLDLRNLVIISVVASVASIKTAAVPEAGSLLTLFVLTATRQPVRDASILVLLELLLDRCNILVNVLGDCFGLALLQHMSVQELEDGSAWQLDPDSREAAQGQQSAGR